MKTLHVKISDESKNKLEDYMEKHELKNLDDAADQFIQNATFDKEEIKQ